MYRKYAIALLGSLAASAAMATLPPCLKPTNGAGVANPGFNAGDSRIASDGMGGYYEKVAPVNITVCTGTTGQCGDSASASAKLSGLSNYTARIAISTAAAGYAPVGSVADFLRQDACLNLVEGTSLSKARTGSASDPQNLAGRQVPQLDVNGNYAANTGVQLNFTVPAMPAGLTGLNQVAWAANGKAAKYQTVGPNGFTGIGVSHVVAWDRITSIDGGAMDAAFSPYLGTNYAYMTGVVNYPSDVAMAAKIASGTSTFGSFYGTDAATKQLAGRTVLSFQCPDDMSLAGADANDLATLGYTRRLFFLPPAELQLAANQLETAVVAAADAGNPPPTNGNIATLRTYLRGLPGSGDARVVDLVITRRYGLGLWGTLFSVTQATVPAAVTSGSPKALDYFLNPVGAKPVAMPFLWALPFMTQLSYTPIVSIASAQFDGFYWSVLPSPLCRPKHKDYDFYNAYAGRSLN